MLTENSFGFLKHASSREKSKRPKPLENNLCMKKKRLFRDDSKIKMGLQVVQNVPNNAH